MNICQTLRKPGGTPMLAMYVNQRDQILGRLMQFYDCSRKAAKELILKHLHGGKVNKWLSDWNIRDDICARAAREGHSRIVVDLERESKAIAEFFVDSFPEFGELLERILTQERANGVAAHNQSTIMTALAHGLATFEDRLLTKLESFLSGKGYRVDSLEFDGLKVFRNGDTGPFPTDVLREAERYLAQQDVGGGTHAICIPMKLEEKSMASLYDRAVEEYRGAQAAVAANPPFHL
jgi:hypothetical protein